MTLRLQFDPNQQHQLDAVESVARLFDGLPLRSAGFMQEEIIPIIRRIFDEEYERLRPRCPFYAGMSAAQVRSAYFAKAKPEKGENEGQAIDTDSRNAQEREAEKAAFALIMKDKERLLSFDEPVCFLFAHSAFKEG